MPYNHDWDLYDAEGNRKYLTAQERKEFFKAIPAALNGKRGREKRTFVLMLYYSGARISEALGVTGGRIDYERRGVVFRTLKRKKQSFRFVPLPSSFLEKLDDVHHIKDFAPKYPDRKIWTFNRQTGWAAVKTVMEKAGIKGAQATPKGLRHSFVIAHQQNKTPPHMIQEWARVGLYPDAKCIWASLGRRRTLFGCRYLGRSVREMKKKL